MIYDYLEAIKSDVLDYIKYNNIEINEDNAEEIEEDLNESLWNDDSITGNASGSYFCNSYKAYECLLGNEDLIEEVKDEFGIDENKAYNWEYLDVSIRCYLLSNAIRAAIEEITE